MWTITQKQKNKQKKQLEARKKYEVRHRQSIERQVYVASDEPHRVEKEVLYNYGNR